MLARSGGKDTCVLFSLRPEFIQPFGVSLHEADWIFRFEDAEAAIVGGAFGETGEADP